jgi:rhomboid family GlyGly-CTERM serine protease
MDPSKFQESKGLSLRLPVLTLLLVGTAVVIAQCPALSSWLIYDRSAILSGQIWRMFTGHWVHFSTSHLVYDSVALGIAGWMIETQKLRNFGWLCLLAPWFISSALLVFEPQMQWFGGLSALATTAVAYLALCGLHDSADWRWVCLALLLGIVGKIAFEITTGRMMFVSGANNSITVCTSSHVAGVLIALVFYGWTTFVNRPCEDRVCRRQSA